MLVTDTLRLVYGGSQVKPEPQREVLLTLADSERDEVINFRARSLLSFQSEASLVSAWLPFFSANVMYVFIYIITYS